jgi:beta-phosphoglucomutase-like phosphatase (HAD superfamily)
MIKAIIFDLDDTLLKTRQTKYQALKYAGKHFYNLDISDEILDKHWGKPYLEFMGEVFEHVDTPEHISNNHKSTVKNFPNIAYADASETIETLVLKYKVCILSSASKSLVEYDIESSGLPLKKFTYIQSAEDTDVHKPDPMVFAPVVRILSKYDIGLDEIVYVGDMLSDAKAALGAGLHFIGIAGRTTPKNDFDTLGVPTVVSLSELIDMIRQL